VGAPPTVWLNRSAWARAGLLLLVAGRRRRATTHRRKRAVHAMSATSTRFFPWPASWSSTPPLS